MYHVYWWPLYDLDLWPRDQKYKFFNMNLCPGHKFFVLCHRHPVFGTWMHHHATMYHVLCLYVCPSVCVNSCLGHNFFVLWRTHIIFSIWVYQYERMYCIHSWPTCDLWPYDLDFWPQGQRYKFSNMDYIWHISVSPWKDISLTFMTSV